MMEPIRMAQSLLQERRQTKAVSMGGTKESSAVQEIFVRAAVFLGPVSSTHHAPYPLQTSTTARRGDQWE